jgi:membrane protein DedA with SNARE-associated domain
VPADVAVALGAFLAQRGEVSAVVLGLVCWAANQASACGVYFFARARGPAFFEGGLGRRLLPPPAMRALAEAGERYGGWSIFLSRFLPGLRAAVLPFAAVVGVSPARALVPAGIATGLWYVLLIVAGLALGKSLDAVKRLVDDVTQVLGLAGLAVAALVAIWLWRRTRAPARS